MTKKFIYIFGSFFIGATMLAASSALIGWAYAQDVHAHPILHVGGMVFGIVWAIASVLGGIAIVVAAFDEVF